MTDKLVYIKNGGSFDGHCGELTYYSPIIYDEDDGLSIDESIKLSCTAWTRPICCEHLETNLKYLISKGGRYGYIHNNVETYFPCFMKKHIIKELEGLSFEHSIYSHY